MSVQMDVKTKRKFVSLWREEFHTATMFQELESEIDYAHSLELPIRRLENRKATWVKKNEAVNEKIRALVLAGSFPENAPAQCEKQLGDIVGYVCDCFHSVWTDYSPMQMSA